MKTIFYLFISFISVLYGCQKEQDFFDQQATPEWNYSKQDLTILNFTSKEAMSDTLNMLIHLSDEMQIAWAKKNNFMSLNILYWEALDELEDIQNSPNYQEYKRRYNAYRKRYSLYFLFNDRDTSDLSPYIATNTTSYALIANIEGKVMINNSLIDINDIEKYDDLDFAKVEKSSINTKSTYFEENINSLYIKTAKRKTWAKVETNMPYVYLKFFAHKKGPFGGWNKYKTTFSVRYIDHDPTNWLAIGSYLTRLRAITPEYMTSPEVQSFSEYIGKTASSTDASRKATAAFEIYSRGTGSENPGLLEIEI